MAIRFAIMRRCDGFTFFMMWYRIAAPITAGMAMRLSASEKKKQLSTSAAQSLRVFSSLRIR